MKFFSIDEANRSLVLVRPIVEDIMSKWTEVKKLKEECDAILLNHLGSESILDQKEDQLDQRLEEIEIHVGELQDVGCEFKGFDEGIVDFPAKISTRMIYLCWKIDEKSVGCWHEIFEGYSGRRKITGDLEEAIKLESNTAQIS